MNFNEAIAFLTRCADDNGVHWASGRTVDAQSCPVCKGTNDAGHLATPCSRYGYTSAHCAPVAYRVARIDGDTSASHLDSVMRLVVNDSDEPETTLREYAIAVSGADINAMVQGYLEAQLWAQNDYDNDGDMLDARYDIDDIAPEYVEQIRAEFAALVTEHPLAVRMFISRHGGRATERSLFGDISVSVADASSLFGHDFYLTREGHGAGFWDRGLGQLGDYLTDIAKYAGAADDLSDGGNGTLTA